MKRFVSLALAASACLCLIACSTVQIQQFDAAITLQVQALGTAKQVLAQYQTAGLLDAATLGKANTYITAAQAALLAAEDAFAAGDATTEQAKLQDVAAALLELDTAVFAVVHGAMSSTTWIDPLAAIERPFLNPVRRS